MSSAAKRTVYYISPLRLWLAVGPLLVIAVLMLVGAAFVSGDPAEQGGLILGGGMLLLCSLFVVVLVRYSRLTLSEDGIRLRQIGYTLATDWQNVSRLYDLPGAQGLVLHRPMTSRGASVLRAFRNTRFGIGRLRFYNQEQAQLLAERRFIPIEAFEYWLKHGRLREDLLRHVPSLTESGE